MPRSGVLFDVDGTLVDSTFIHTICWTEALRQNGHVVPSATLHHCVGMSSEALLSTVLGEDRDTDADDDIISAHMVLYKQYWGRLNTLPQAADLLEECAKRGLTVVLASSASPTELQELTRTLDADDAITQTTDSSDAEAGKPAPDIVQTALDGVGLRPEDAVFVGDAMWDGSAATKAGVTFIGLTCGGTPESDLREAGAVEVWSDPADLLEHLADSAIGALLTRAG